MRTNLILNIKSAFLCLIMLGLAHSANAQTLTVKLWPDSIPGAINCPDYIEKVNGVLVEQISNPEILVYLPPQEKANDTAVLICPGGGYWGVAVYHQETVDITKWLNEQGIAAIVLKYRLPSDKIMKNKSIGPLQDAQQAMRIIRKNAKQWHINPQKVGVMGMSAGGHLAATLSTHYDAKVYKAENISARPDFTVLECPAISFTSNVPHNNAGGSATVFENVIENLIGKNPTDAALKYYSTEQQVTTNTPPAFLAHAADDTIVPFKQSITYFQALLDHKIPAEIHIIQKGGHDLLPETWFQSFLLWMKGNGWL